MYCPSRTRAITTEGYGGDSLGPLLAACPPQILDLYCPAPEPAVEGADMEDTGATAAGVSPEPGAGSSPQPVPSSACGAPGGGPPLTWETVQAFVTSAVTSATEPLQERIADLEAENVSLWNEEAINHASDANFALPIHRECRHWVRWDYACT